MLLWAERDKLRTKLETLQAENQKLRERQKTGSVSAFKEVKTAQAELRSAHSKLRSAHSELEAAQTELKEVRLRAQLAEGRGEQIERLTEENQRLRDERKQRTGLNTELVLAQEELREAQVMAQAAESRGAEVERLLAENQKLRESACDLESLRADSDKLEALRGEHQSTRVESEVMRRRLAGLEEINVECVELRHQVSMMTKDIEEAERLRKDVQSLEAQLFASGQTPKKANDAPTPGGGRRIQYDLTEGSQIAQILARFKTTPGLRTAVVADNQGLLIGGVGDDSFHEEIAALSGLAEGLAERSRKMLPMDQIYRIYVHDSNEMILSCRFFSSEEDLYALAALSGQEAPPREAEDAAVEALSGALSGYSPGHMT